MGNQAQRLRLASLVGEVPHHHAASPHITSLAAAPEQEEITTVMLRNIPLKYNRDMLLADLNARGFTGCYDFFMHLFSTNVFRRGGIRKGFRRAVRTALAEFRLLLFFLLVNDLSGTNIC